MNSGVIKCTAGMVIDMTTQLSKVLHSSRVLIKQSSFSSDPQPVNQLVQIAPVHPKITSDCSPVSATV